MNHPQDVDMSVLKRAMFDVINEYVPSVDSVYTDTDDLKESNKELAKFIIDDISPKLQEALEIALDPDKDLETFMRLHGVRMMSSNE